MDGIKEVTKNVESKPGFISHVFNFDDTSKKELMNITQYSLLSIIPIAFLNKSIQQLIPEADDSKGSIEILAEICTQIILLFLGIFFIHRIVSYVPTYSKLNYENFNVVNIVIGFLVIVLSLQTKLGLKLNILTERILNLVEGQTGVSLNNKPKVTKEPEQQPETQSNNPNFLNLPNSQQTVGQPNLINANDFKMPSGAQQGPPPTVATQPTPDFNQMYSGPTTPLVGANTPGQQSPPPVPPSTGATPISQFPLQNNEPMAANDAFGSSFGSAF